MMEKLVLLLIKFYKCTISPFLKSQCKYYPTCSEYALLAIHRYGLFKGIIKSIARIIRCNPFSNGGIDFP